MQRIYEQPNTVAMPIIDSVVQETFEPQVCVCVCVCVCVRAGRQEQTAITQPNTVVMPFIDSVVQETFEP